MITIARLLIWGVFWVLLSIFGIWRLAAIVGLFVWWQSVKADETAPAPAELRAEPAAATRGPVTNLPLPRYVSLRSDEVNVRRGPGRNFRRDWVYFRAGLPVMVVEEYGDWRRIVDSDNAGGWVYHALITGKRTVLITASPSVLLREAPQPQAFPVAEAEQGVVAALLACLVDWCEIEAEGYDGWVPKSAIWGTTSAEVFD